MPAFPYPSMYKTGVVPHHIVNELLPVSLSRLIVVNADVRPEVAERGGTVATRGCEFVDMIY
jgi:hypothetical protein